MLSYLDIFILIVTLLVLVLTLNVPKPAKVADPALAHDAPDLIDQIVRLPASSAGTVSNASAQPDWLALFRKTLSQEHLENLVTIHEQSEVTELNIATRVLFNAGEAELTRAGKAVLTELLPAIAQTSGMVYIEGHTDDLPFFDDQFATNWELAAARASQVLKYFVAEGLDDKRFRAASFADTQPVAPNTNESNRQKNRRITLVIHRHMKN